MTANAQGLGNGEHERGNYDAAVRYNEAAVEADSDDIFAWHDMFAVYAELARRGEVHVEAMRKALQAVESLEGKDHVVGRQQIQLLRRVLGQYEGDRTGPVR